MSGRDATADLDDDVALPVRDVEGGHVTAHPLRDQINGEAVLLDVKDVLIEEHP